MSPARAEAQRPISFGPYQLIRRIGAGGMGEVYLAREAHEGASRACVVKKVLPSLIENRAFIGRFLDEAKVVTQLSHPNIARVYAMGEVDGQYYLSMEYVQGKTVSRFMHRLRTQKQVMPPGMVLLIGERMCEGLAYAHDAVDEHGAPLHLVHRDLSPANVCISYRGEVKIIDFGAAQSTLKEEKTAPRVVIGNLTYMSPEQARKKFVDRRADVYSAAVVLWELLAWRTLPQKGDPIERWRKAANPVWESPSLHRPDLPQVVSLVLAKALRKEPSERYPDAAAFGAELRRLREELFPGMDDAALGDALTLAFAEEKADEDALLRDVEGGAPEDEVTDRSDRRAIVPPTALAFEHTGVQGPAEFVPGPEDEATDPGEPSVPAGQPALGEGEVQISRVFFGAAAKGGTGTLRAEIEGEGYDTGDYQTPQSGAGDPGRRLVWVAVALFLVALVAGFVGVLLLGM